MVLVGKNYGAWISRKKGLDWTWTGTGTGDTLLRQLELVWFVYGNKS